MESPKCRRATAVGRPLSALLYSWPALWLVPKLFSCSSSRQEVCRVLSPSFHRAEAMNRRERCPPPPAVPVLSLCSPSLAWQGVCCQPHPSFFLHFCLRLWPTQARRSISSGGIAKCASKQGFALPTLMLLQPSAGVLLQLPHMGAVRRRCAAQCTLVMEPCSVSCCVGVRVHSSGFTVAGASCVGS